MLARCLQQHNKHSQGTAVSRSRASRSPSLGRGAALQLIVWGPDQAVNAASAPVSGFELSESSSSAALSCGGKGPLRFALLALKLCS